VTLAIMIINPVLILALCTKLVLVILLWIMLGDRSLRQRLRYYRISGVSNFKFFAVLFILDSIFTCSFMAILKGFI
jgi:hypothetical protein